jgi:hypothetical protein
MRGGQNRPAAAKRSPNPSVSSGASHRGSDHGTMSARACHGAVRHRTVDSLSTMLRAGTISRDMHDAARDFQATFIVATLDPLRAVPVLRVPGTRGEPELGDRQIDARRRVHEAMRALGGINSPAGSCVWHVVGLQRSVREWAIRQGWNGRPVRQGQAQGILVAALGVMARGREP